LSAIPDEKMKEEMSLNKRKDASEIAFGRKLNKYPREIVARRRIILR
jgi:hypothetical protein